MKIEVIIQKISLSQKNHLFWSTQTIFLLRYEIVRILPTRSIKNLINLSKVIFKQANKDRIIFLEIILE